MLKGIRIGLAVLAAGSLLGCGGGGGGDSGNSTSISVQPSSMSFHAGEGEPEPAPIRVVVNFKGDGVLVGYAPGTPQAYWLSVADGQYTSSTAEFFFYASDTSNPGLRSTSVRFVTGHTDGSDIKYVDVPVSFNVVASNLAISAAPTALSFSADTNGAVPPAQTVDTTFNGDSVAVVGQPGWATVTATSATSQSPAGFSVVPNGTGYSAGTYNDFIAFSTSRAGSTAQRTVYVPVSYTLTEPFSATAPAMPFNALNKSGQAAQPAAGYAVQIRGTNARWRISADHSWVKYGVASGSGPAAVTITADPSLAAQGSNSAQITVTDDDSSQTRVFDVTLVNRAANLVVTPSNAQFTLDSATGVAGMAKTITVTDELGSAQASEAVSWSLWSTGADWLKWSPASGTSVPAVQASLSLDPDKLRTLRPGIYSTTVRLTYTNADVANQALSIPVSLDLRLPLVQFVAPYLGATNVPGALTLRGLNFSDAGSTATVTVGGAELGPFAVDSATQLRLSYPALPAGRYPVAIKNAAGIARTDAELVVMDPPALAYHAIAAPSAKTRLVWDAERSVLYGVNRQDQQIERYAYSGGNWSTLAPVGVANLTNLDLSPNGRLMAISSKLAMLDADLTAAQFTPQSRVTIPADNCSGFLDGLAMANNGKAFITYNYRACSGFSPSYLYDIVAHTLTQNPYFVGWLYDGVVAGAADGSRVYAGTGGVSPAQPIKIFDPLDNSVTDSPLDYGVNRMATSGDGSTVILQGVDVFDRSLTKLGHLPVWPAATIPSHDGTRALVYYDSPARVDIYDLTAAPDGDGNLPLLRTITLPDAASSSQQDYYVNQLTVTPDDKTLFISGDARVLVVPLGP